MPDYSCSLVWINALSLAQSLSVPMLGGTSSRTCRIGLDCLAPTLGCSCLSACLGVPFLAPFLAIEEFVGASLRLRRTCPGYPTPRPGCSCSSTRPDALAPAAVDVLCMLSYSCYTQIRVVLVRHHMMQPDLKSLRTVVD